MVSPVNALLNTYAKLMTRGLGGVLTLPSRGLAVPNPVANGIKIAPASKPSATKFSVLLAPSFAISS